MAARCRVEEANDVSIAMIVRDLLAQANGVARASSSVDSSVGARATTSVAWVFMCFCILLEHSIVSMHNTNIPSVFLFAFLVLTMAERRTPRISSRKQPKQARSNELVSSILEAAIHVLVKEGAQRFTTTRVAERAGVSVGSIYQYFPNKVAILFRLQSDEWRRTSEMMCRILEDQGRSPPERLRALVHNFVISECEEAEMRVALNDAAPLYRDEPEAREARAAAAQAMLRFIQEALPDASLAEQQQVSDVISTTLSAVGKGISASPRMLEEVDAHADALSDMFCGYLDRRSHGGFREVSASAG